MSHTILIIDDSETVHHHIEQTLGLHQAFAASTFLHAKDGGAGFKILCAQPVDLILCDIIMPGIDGLKFLALKQTQSVHDNVPVIMLTGEEDLQVKMRCFDVGAADCLSKPFHPEELVARVRVQLNMRALRHELLEKNRQLESLSRTDELTKLHNRRSFFELLDLEYQRSMRYRTPFVFGMLDLDHFKNVNDTYGHGTGDKVLATVALVLGRSLRVTDAVGRYGGEEFGIIMAQTGLDGGILTAHRIRKLIESAPVNVEGGGQINVTASIGLVFFSGAKKISLTDVINLADKALYRAKNEGRNRVVVADEP